MQIAIPDLRRRDARLHAEQISQRAAFLTPHERALILGVYEQGRSLADLAVLAGVSVRCLRRDVQRILRRLASPEFIYVASHRDSWPSGLRRVATCCVLHGETVRTAAETLHLSLHTVRKYRVIVQTLAAGSAGISSGRARSRAG